MKRLFIYLILILFLFSLVGAQRIITYNKLSEVCDNRSDCMTEQGVRWFRKVYEDNLFIGLIEEEPSTEQQSFIMKHEENVTVLKERIVSLEFQLNQMSAFLDNYGLELENQASHSCSSSNETLYCDRLSSSMRTCYPENNTRIGAMLCINGGVWLEIQ